MKIALQGIHLKFVLTQNGAISAARARNDGDVNQLFWVCNDGLKPGALDQTRSDLAACSTRHVGKANAERRSHGAAGEVLKDSRSSS